MYHYVEKQKLVGTRSAIAQSVSVCLLTIEIIPL